MNRYRYGGWIENNAEYRDLCRSEAIEAHRRYIQSDEWKARRLRALELGGNHCRVCGATEKLEVHHLTYTRLGYEDDDDLMVLCSLCHREVTRGRNVYDMIEEGPAPDTRKLRKKNTKKMAWGHQ